MKLIKVLFVTLPILLTGCNQPPAANSSEAPHTSDAAEEIALAPRPESIIEKMKARGGQDDAKPELIVESPKEGETIKGSTVRIKVRIGGDLMGLEMGKDDAGAGNHVHVILDNQPYAAHYMWNEGFELRNVKDGEHTLRMFASRPWHESYKNEKAFKIIKFRVTGGKADKTKPTTDGNENKMADAEPEAKTNEGADVGESHAGKVDFSAPLLTYSRPKGEYKGADAESILLDFWLANARLSGDGGEFRVRYTINGQRPGIIEKWEPIWLKGWKRGKNSVKLELIDPNGEIVENGGYNSTTREILVNPE